MTFLPIVAREMRAEAHRPENWRLRVGAAIIFSLCFLTAFLGAGPMQRVTGDQIFWRLHMALFAGIWLVVPALTADSISRERREGTLGLLFLTPLTPIGVVLGKTTVLMLRAAMILAAALPLLTGCVVLGGVGWYYLAASFAFNSSALCLALAAGILASACSRRLARALLAAQLLAGLFLVLSMAFLVEVGTTMSGLKGNAITPWTFFEIFLWCANCANVWQQDAVLTAVWQKITVVMIAGSPLFAVAVLMASLWAASRIVGRTWRETPRLPAVHRLGDRFTTPVIFRAWLLRFQRRNLGRAPLQWLQQRSWNARVTKWGWCLGITGTETILSGDSHYAALAAQPWVAGALLLGISSAGASSYGVERDTGLLELLLVAPVSEAALIRARISALGRQFLPATSVLLGSWIYLAGTFSEFRSQWVLWLRFLVIAVTVAAAGLYFALQFRHFLAAWLSTIGCAMLLPLFIALLTPEFRPGSFMLSLGLAAMFIYYTNYDLVRRRFALT